MLSDKAVNQIKENVEFIFIDGDHSLEGIQKDWDIYSVKVVKGGFILLHDTTIPKHDSNVANLASYNFFDSTIKYDKRFEIIETVDSLNVLKRL